MRPIELYTAANNFASAPLNAYPAVIYKLDRRCTCSDTCSCERIIGMQLKGAGFNSWLPGFIRPLAAKIFPGLIRGVVLYGVHEDKQIEVILSGRMGTVDDGNSYLIATFVCGAANVVVKS